MPSARKSLRLGTPGKRSSDMKNYIAKTGSMLVAFLTALVMVLSLSGCQKATDKMDEVVNNGLSKVENATKSEYGSAQEIVDLYSAKMEKQAKVLGKELKSEAPARYKQDGTLAKLLKEKTTVLANLYGEGSAEVSNYILYSSGNSSQSPTPFVDDLYEAYTKATDLLMDDYQDALSELM